MTSHIFKLFQIAVSTLAIVPFTLSLNLSPVRAELTPEAIGGIANLTEKIAQNADRSAPVIESTDDNSNAETTVRDRSMAYVQSGYEAQEAGHKELALANYYTAAQVDPSNGYAFLFAGLSIGQNETGIECVKFAAQLFKAQNDLEGYKVASELLQAVN